MAPHLSIDVAMTHTGDVVDDGLQAIIVLETDRSSLRKHRRRRFRLSSHSARHENLETHELEEETRCIRSYVLLNSSNDTSSFIYHTYHRCYSIIIIRQNL